MSSSWQFYIVGRNTPVNEVAAALVTCRAICFLLPMLLSTVLLATVELKRSLDTAIGRRIGRAASRLAPGFLAATTFVVGGILVVSGAMPAFIDRLQILHVAVPLWAVEVSHFLTSVAGLVLLFAAHGLYHRLDGARWLALCMTLLSIPFSLIKGLAVVAPSVSIILLIGLVAGRRQFSRRASLLSQPLALSWFIAIGCVMAAMVWVLFFAFRNVEYAHELWWQFEFDATAPRALRAVLNDAAIALTRDGALVVGVDLPDYLARLDAHSGEACHDVVGDIDSISRQVQRERGNTLYLTPIVAGIGEGGALAPAILARAPAATIAGAVSYDPTVAVHTRIPLCSTPGAKTDLDGGFVYGPWPSLPGFWVVAFPVGSNGPERQHIAVLKAAGTPVDIASHAGSGAAETLAALMGPHLTPVATSPPTGIAKLPLIELPAEQSGPLLAIVLSGDGGWRDIDKTVSEKLQSAGVSVVGWDCLRYFWSRKSPEQVARDLGAVVDTFLSRWGGSKVVLVGYSFGADVLPFAYDRLSPETKSHIVQLSLLGFSTAADFEIRVAGLVGAGPSKEALPTEPTLAPIPTIIQCFYGADEDDSACRFLQGKAEVIRTTGGHHFDGNYGALAQRILDGLRRRAAL